MDRPVLELLERLSAARTADAVWAAAAAGLSAVGVEWCHHAYHPGAWSAPGGPGWMRRSTLPPSWTEHYAARRYRLIDAASRHCAHAVTPCPVGEEFARAAGDAAWAGMCAEAAASVGVGCGLAVPLRPAPGTGAGGFSLLTRLRGPAFEAWRAAHGRGVVLVAQATSLRLLEAADEQPARTPSRDAPPRLSRRERECLLWLAAGLRNDRIAERLGIARATVELHLARARRKLGAATREQALAKALCFGLIEP
jgi:DNA-binding CsgD family transcriptional regulator